MSYMKGVRSGAEGNRSLLKQYGGNSGSGPAARQHYASGGAVKGGNPSLNEGLSAAADGKPAKPSLARPGRKMPGKSKSKGGKTNVNVIIAQAPDKGAMPPALGAGPGGPPPMPPPGPPPGGPPMPMRASGGRIANLGKYAHGGKVTTKGDEAGRIAKKETHGAEPYAKGGHVKRADGGPTPGEQMNAARKRRDDASSDRTSEAIKGASHAGIAAGLAGVPGKLGKVLKWGNAAISGSGVLGAASAHGRKGAAEAEMKRLGEGKATEGEEDRKAGGRVARKEGGPVMGLKNSQGGAGGGSGRLAKVRMYGK